MVVGNAFDEAQRLGAGVLLFAGEKIEPLLVNAHKGRIALGVELSGPVSDWLADDVLGAMLELRAESDRVGAHDIVVVLTDADPARLDEDLQLLGVVVGTSVRCRAHQVEFLAPDTCRWLHDLTHLHREVGLAPGRA
jgi:hypothetical protein